MTTRFCIALATLLTTSTLACAQSPAATPDAATKAAPVTAGGNAATDKGSRAAAAAPTSAFAIDQKGVKRETAMPAGTKAVDEKRVKKTGDPLPDVDVSYKRPPSQRLAAPASGAAGATADTAARQHKEVNKSRDDARVGTASTDKAATKDVASPTSPTTGIFKN
jgi:hypothetical protein